MDVHNNAQLTPRGRATMVAQVLDHGWSYRATARAFYTTTRTVRRWVRGSRPKATPVCSIAAVVLAVSPRARPAGCSAKCGLCGASAGP